MVNAKIVNVMSEIKIFYKENEKIKVAKTIDKLKELDKKDIIWIDLLDVSDKTEDRKTKRWKRSRCRPVISRPTTLS